MKFMIRSAMLTFLLLLVACHTNGPKSKLCFDDLRASVCGKSAQEIQSLLGEPDLREPVVLGGERWVWWDYTYLDGKRYPPEMRGRLVHLEIVFERQGKPSEVSLSSLRVSDSLSVSYALSQQTR